MWPFKRRGKPPEEDEAAWSVAQGHYEGSPLFARIRRDPGHPIRVTHNHRVGIAVPLLSPDSRGLPQGEEFSALSEIEDALSAALESGAKSVHVLSITTSGMREFVFYTCDPVWAEGTFRSVQGQVHTHELQLSIESDPEWSVYQQFSR
jgi:hypothetical protein